VDDARASQVADEVLRNAGLSGPGRPGAAFALDDSGGRWVTIGSREGEDGKRRGGVPVFISSAGRIVKGPARLTGRNVGTLTEEAPPTSHRQQMRESRERERIGWAKRAKAAGVRPDDLHELAGELREHHDTYIEQRQRIVRRAKELLKHYGYNPGALTTNLRSGRVEGVDQVPHFDEVASTVASEHPAYFRTGDAAHELLDMLTEGVPQPMSEEDSYREALELLSGRGVPAEEPAISHYEEIPLSRSLPPNQKVPALWSRPLPEHLRPPPAALPPPRQVYNAPAPPAAPPAQHTYGRVPAPPVVSADRSAEVAQEQMRSNGLLDVSGLDADEQAELGRLLSLAGRQAARAKGQQRSAIMDMIRDAQAIARGQARCGGLHGLLACLREHVGSVQEQ
jgi:hypothetical protein